MTTNTNNDRKSIRTGLESIFLESSIRAAQTAAGDGQDWEYEQAAPLQKLIDSGAVWSLEGSAGRAAMAALESGACFLPLCRSRDYYGNTIPSRSDVRPGSKGTLENSANYYGL